MAKTGIIYRKDRVLVKQISRENLKARLASYYDDIGRPTHGEEVSIKWFEGGVFLRERVRNKEYVYLFIVKEEKGGKQEQ